MFCAAAAGGRRGWWWCVCLMRRGRGAGVISYCCAHACARCASVALRRRQPPPSFLLRLPHREVDSVTDKENREVDADNIEVAFLGVKFHSESSRVAQRLGRVAAANDGAEAHARGRALADAIEHLGARVVAHVVRHLWRGGVLLCFGARVSSSSAPGRHSRSQNTTENPSACVKNP